MQLKAKRFPQSRKGKQENFEFVVFLLATLRLCANLNPNCISTVRSKGVNQTSNLQLLSKLFKPNRLTCTKLNLHGFAGNHIKVIIDKRPRVRTRQIHRTRKLV